MNKLRRKQKLHEPVLLDELGKFLEIEKFAHLNIQASIIDATLGLGGHSGAFVKSGWKVLGIDADKDAIEVAKNILELARPARLLSKAGTFKVIHGNFKDIKKIATENGFSEVNAILFDLGVSSVQLTSKDRGFSFQNPNAVLDMRLDTSSQNVKAFDLLNTLSEKQLIKLFEVAMPYTQSRKLVRRVVKQRSIKEFRVVSNLLEVIQRRANKKSSLHPATLPFMALRIAVNSELEVLRQALIDAFGLLEVGGKLAVISFHSGEDAIVKHLFKELEVGSAGKIITKKPILPTDKEISKNPRARSAKLRVIQKK